MVQLQVCFNNTFLFHIVFAYLPHRIRIYILFYFDYVIIYLVDSGIMLCLMQSIIPLTTNIPEAYAHGSSEEQVRLCNLAIS